jgi:hypothetical protein
MDRLHPDLAGALQQYQTIRSETEQILDGMTDVQFGWRPAPDRWSVGENLDHLLIAGRQFAPILDDLLGRGHADHVYATGPFRHTFVGDWIIRRLEPPYKIKVKTIKEYQPRPNLIMGAVTAQFLALQDQMMERLHQADGLDLANLTAPLPWLPIVKLSLGQFFRLVAAHERRHLYQISTIIGDPALPE